MRIEYRVSWARFSLCFTTMRPFHDAMSETKTRQKMTKKRSLYVINEYFESFFNAVFVSAVVVQRSRYHIRELNENTTSRA